MAQSRLEKIGTIFTRTTGLLKSGAMKTEDKPLWYEVYAAFNPKLEPRFDRSPANINIRNIFYTEDVIRAKYHKSLKQHEIINISDMKTQSQTQKFISVYYDLVKKGPLDPEQIFKTANECINVKRMEDLEDIKFGSQNNEFLEIEAKENIPKTTRLNKISKPVIDIPNLFKE